jgi:hypothetical protein
VNANVKNEELMKNVKNVKAKECEQRNLVTTCQLVYDLLFLNGNMVRKVKKWPLPK